MGSIKSLQKGDVLAWNRSSETRFQVDNTDTLPRGVQVGHSRRTTSADAEVVEITVN